jgi:septal ring factor EnvC (AmiA/AmiB activator)
VKSSTRESIELEKMLKQSLRKSKRFAKKFVFPVKDFKLFKRRKNGVNFVYSKSQDLYSPKLGKVVYVGELASYGKVIVIEHANDMRSVLLGTVNPTVKKNQEVDYGQKVGRLVAKNHKNYLYFEIRKKNKVQNTLAFLKK